MSNPETTVAGAPEPVEAAAAVERAQARESTESAEAQILRVLRGNPNPDEVAALIVALAHVRARNAAEAGRTSGPGGGAAGGGANLPTSATWDRPQPVVYRSPTSWMRAA